MPGYVTVINIIMDGSGCRFDLAYHSSESRCILGICVCTCIGGNEFVFNCPFHIYICLNESGYSEDQLEWGFVLWQVWIDGRLVLLYGKVLLRYML